MLDVNSGSVHVVDDIVYDIIALYENSSVDEIADKLLSLIHISEPTRRS